MAGKDHLFKPGQSGNPAGRPKGSRNVLTENFITALTKDFAEHGVAAIRRAREDDPAAYLRLVASLAPKELHMMRENRLTSSATRKSQPFSPLQAISLMPKLEAEQRRRMARANLLAFTEYTKPNYAAAAHHRLVCDKVGGDRASPRS